MQPISNILLINNVISGMADFLMPFLYEGRASHKLEFLYHYQIDYIQTEIA